MSDSPGMQGIGPRLALAGVENPEPSWWAKRVHLGTGPRDPRVGLMIAGGPASGPHLWTGQQALGVLFRHVAPGGQVCSGPWCLHPTG